MLETVRGAVKRFKKSGIAPLNAIIIINGFYQAFSVIGSKLGLVSSVLAYCDWVRLKIRSAASSSVWQHLRLS